MCHENVGLVFADCTDCPQSTNISQNHEKSRTAHWTSQKLTRFSLENNFTCMWIKPQFSSSIRIRTHSNGAGGGWHSRIIFSVPPPPPLFYSTCPEIRKFSFSSLVDVLFSEQKIAKNNSRQKFQCYQNAENKF